MTRKEIITAITKAGITATLTDTGILIAGTHVLHTDETGISQFRQIKFRARDPFEFLMNLHAEGLQIESQYFRATRTAQKEL